MSEVEQTIGATLERWNRVIEDCSLTVYGIQRMLEIRGSQLNNWLRGITIPNKKSQARVEELLMKLRPMKRIPYSPIWGYATPRQIERLKECIPEQERERIMKQIEKQTKLGGKID